MAESESSSLTGVHLLTDLGSEELRALERSCRWKRYTAHEQIIDRQSETRDVFFVVHGKVRVANYSLSGQEITLDDLAEGSHFGELAALDGEPRSASVTALTDSLIAALPRERFLAALTKHPSIALKVMMQLTRIVRTSDERIMDLSTLGANNRVHAELLRQARMNTAGENTARIMPIPMHADIASRVSTTRETVARVLNDLARQGIVERGKDVLIIHDMERLQTMVEKVRGE